jgi:hypothetical protein
LTAGRIAATGDVSVRKVKFTVVVLRTTTQNRHAFVRAIGVVAGIEDEIEDQEHQFA